MRVNRSVSRISIEISCRRFIQQQHFEHNGTEQKWLHCLLKLLEFPSLAFLLYIWIMAIDGVLECRFLKMEYGFFFFNQKWKQRNVSCFLQNNKNMYRQYIDFPAIQSCARTLALAPAAWLVDVCVVRVSVSDIRLKNLKSISDQSHPSDLFRCWRANSYWDINEPQTTQQSKPKFTQTHNKNKLSFFFQLQKKKKKKLNTISNIH